MKNKINKERWCSMNETPTPPNHLEPPARSLAGHRTKTGQDTRQSTDGVITLNISYVCSMRDNNQQLNHIN
jgi:hypothetical protein